MDAVVCVLVNVFVCVYVFDCILACVFVSVFLFVFVFVIICLFALPDNSGKDSSKNISEKAESNARDEVSPRAEVEEVQVEPGVILSLCLYLFCIF